MTYSTSATRFLHNLSDYLSILPKRYILNRVSESMAVNASYIRVPSHAIDDCFAAKVTLNAHRLPSQQIIDV